MWRILVVAVALFAAYVGPVRAEASPVGGAPISCGAKDRAGYGVSTWVGGAGVGSQDCSMARRVERKFSAALVARGDVVKRVCVRGGAGAGAVTCYRRSMVKAGTVLRVKYRNGECLVTIEVKGR